MKNISDFTKLDNENYHEYIWRIDGFIQSGKYANWREVTPLVNKELFGDDEEKYRDESAYRKAVKYARDFYDAGVFGNEDDYLLEVKLQKQELEKEKVKFRDERNSLYARYRDLARNEADLDILERKIAEKGKFEFKPHYSIINGNKDMFAALSDIHLGATNESSFGSYNSDITKKRLEDYLAKIIELQKLHNAKNCFIGLLGDLINSNIHVTLQITNRENVIEQIQKCSELLSSFVFELSKVFENVYVNSVSGNHTRLTKKDDSLRNERTDELIPWYMKAKLSHIENIKFTSADENIDPTIATFTIRGKEYFMVHGDWDSYSESGVSKLVLMTGYRPEGIFYGHLHKCSYDDIAGIKIIRSGSFSGTGDDYCISKRIKGNASQMVCICTDNGVEACYPITLN